MGWVMREWSDEVRLGTIMADSAPPWSRVLGRPSRSPVRGRVNESWVLREGDMVGAGRCRTSIESSSHETLLHSQSNEAKRRILSRGDDLSEPSEASGSHGDLIKRRTMVWRRKGKAGVVGRPQVARTKRKKNPVQNERRTEEKRERRVGTRRRETRRDTGNGKGDRLGSWVATREESGLRWPDGCMGGGHSLLRLAHWR